MTDESLRALPRDVPDYHARHWLRTRAPPDLKLGYWIRRSSTTGSLPRLRNPTEPGPLRPQA
jgi:hypothetical protein